MILHKASIARHFECNSNRDLLEKLNQNLPQPIGDQPLIDASLSLIGALYAITVELLKLKIRRQFAYLEEAPSSETGD